MPTVSNRPDRLLALALLVFGAGAAANAVLGPLFSDTFDYPLSITTLNRIIGQDAFGLIVLVPLCGVLAVGIWRGVPAASVLAMGPGGFGMYMFAQHMTGPAYTNYPTRIVLHLGLFVLAGFILARAWQATRSIDPPSRQGSWVGGWEVLAVFLAFVLTRHLDAVAGILGSGGALDPELLDDPAMYWSVFWWDLGVIAPLTVVAIIGVVRASPWSSSMLHGLVSGYVLLVASAAAMAITASAKDDPFTDTADAVLVTAVAAAYAVLAAVVLAPLRTLGRAEQEHPG